MIIKFDDIIDHQRWQVIQDYFAEVLGIPLRTVNNKGLLVTRPSKPGLCCPEILNTSIEKNLDELLSWALDGPKQNWKEGTNLCANFYDFSIPLKVGKERIASVIAGPVIVGNRLPSQKYQEIAITLNVDAEKFLNAVRDLKSFSFHGIKLVLELIHEVGCSLCEKGYQKMQALKASAGLTEYTEKLLKALLETAFSYSRADRGSLMLFDETKNELYIKMAKGLRQDIIDRTRLKVGEGLAGIAAEEEKVMVIDRNVRDRRIQRRLNNPELKQSLIIPLKVKKKLFGVLNLGSFKESLPRFSAQDIENIDNLTKLVEATLSNIF